MLVFLLLRFPLPCFLPVVLLGGLLSRPAPLNLLAPLGSSSPPGSAFKSESNSETETVAAYVTLFFNPSKSMPAYSHHHQDTLAPGRRVERSQRSRIGPIAIYCATVFCLLMTKVLIPSNPASPIASAKGG